MPRLHQLEPPPPVPSEEEDEPSLELDHERSLDGVGPLGRSFMIGAGGRALATIREFALSVITSESLEAKLSPPPADLADLHREGVIPASPARSVALRPVARERTPMPRTTQLGRADKRAICLHRFANHELQAVELMAWALLAYPTAPEAFRRGVLATLADEQEHARLYVARLAELGMGFGDLPVNDYFWGRTRDLATPLHYVAAMGLTFEAANLDHSSAYARAFAEHGDEASARLLERVHREEVGHVAFATTWLRRLKDPLVSDWDAWLAHLGFPLGPHRARGPSFHAASRLEAGLTADFVAALEAVPARMLGPARSGPA